MNAWSSFFEFDALSSVNFSGRLSDICRRSVSNVRRCFRRQNCPTFPTDQSDSQSSMKLKLTVHKDSTPSARDRSICMHVNEKFRKSKKGFTALSMQYCSHIPEPLSWDLIWLKRASWCYVIETFFEIRKRCRISTFELVRCSAECVTNVLAGIFDRYKCPSTFWKKLHAIRDSV